MSIRHTREQHKLGTLLNGIVYSLYMG